MIELPISQLVPPPKKSRLLREVDGTFLTHLKKKMEADPAALGACPMAVLCKDVDDPDNFVKRRKDVYTYEVLGGLHSLLAKSQLTMEQPDNPFSKQLLPMCMLGCLMSKLYVWLDVTMPTPTSSTR